MHRRAEAEALAERAHRLTAPLDCYPISHVHVSEPIGAVRLDLMAERAADLEAERIDRVKRYLARELASEA